MDSRQVASTQPAAGDGVRCLCLWHGRSMMVHGSCGVASTGRGVTMFGSRKAVLEMAAGAASAGGGAQQYAGFWARVAALMVDSAILMIAGVVLLVVLGMALGGTGVALGNILFFFAQLLYWPVMESSARQATFGKGLLGIEVTDLEGNRVSFIKALL